jgi:Na+-translocating ferredoxin:NAD+ oxidoreductase RnfG subunit
MKTILISAMFLATILCAKEPLSLKKIFSDTFSHNHIVTQKNIVLTKTEKTLLEQKAKARIDSTKIRFYVVKKENQVEGYAVLLIQKIRTKKAVILYLIDKNVKIKNIEILAFHEPSEYKPYNTWKESFVGKGMNDDVRMGYGVPTISGATLSARALTNAARIALAIVLKERN